MTGRVPRVAVFCWEIASCLGYPALALMLYATKTPEGNLIRELSAPAGEGTVLKINVLGR